MAKKIRPTLSNIIHPEATDKYQWLLWLKRAYELADSQTVDTIKFYKNNGLPKIACEKGCAACCYNPNVPVTMVELQGLSWYSCEVMSREKQNILIQNILVMHETTKCPFLINDTCSVYPLRPLACRHFLVTGRKCGLGEDIIETRAGDIVWLEPKNCKKVAELIFRAKGESSIKSRLYAKQGKLLEITRPLHEANLKEMIKMILAFRQVRGL